MAHIRPTNPFKGPAQLTISSSTVLLPRPRFTFSNSNRCKIEATSLLTVSHSLSLSRRLRGPAMATTPTKTPSSQTNAPKRPLQSRDSTSDLRSRFEAYNRLQAAAVAFGEKLPIPEIVALGGQSDGKSSLLEALLGFRFNVREVEMGTRRPLILQMVHDPSALEPRCQFQDEESEEYGSPVVSASAIADILRSRTESLLKRTKTAVSSKPIVMRAEYAHCPNLTIIDTPGFVLKVGLAFTRMEL